MKRVAVIGLGEIAKVHVPILKSMEQVQLCAVCDLRKERGTLAPDVPSTQTTKKCWKRRSQIVCTCACPIGSIILLQRM